MTATNPSGWIVKANVERALEGSGSPGHLGASLDPSALDSDYLSSLGADAVPGILAVLPNVSPADRCRLSRDLLARWGAQDRVDWRTWSLAGSRARAAIHRYAPELEAHTVAEGGCERRG